ncbi:ArsR/SmtB family transcription factor [Halarsenatibacter silvermanii]|uniref:DNA-binding transcriptional regulator, ArsR family n=1 Tax=Halarsenatibacter silvermanii TaxID=321763 RepID=A0A1G9R1C7_9FIRM|nr:metalloregulator ArsR/SmtB family transcription factor [Halarsenatibacter silvermanii]SDM16941.1 DNA-binding transcriptional regulator, ArsR family [Halarsenatibacter silvermanii]
MGDEQQQNIDVQEEKDFETCQHYCPHWDKIESLENDNLARGEVKELASTFKVLGDPTRLRIINALAREELCVCDISELLDMSQSAISHQLKKLRDLDLVKYRKEGRVVYYSLSDDHILQLFCQGLNHVRE